MNALPGNPLLAETVDLDTLQFPVWAFPKIDGVRGLPVDGVMFSRRLKPFPNRLIQRMTAEAHLPEGIDGELILGSDPKAPGRLCNRTSGALMRASKDDAEFTFWLFDIQVEGVTFTGRYDRLISMEKDGVLPSWVKVIRGEFVRSVEELEAVEAKWVDAGYEGVVVRKPDGYYKFGRSTQSQALLLRFCRSKRSEAKVIGFVEALANDNEATISETGHTKRSTHKSNMRPKDTLGALRVVDIETNEEFTVGTGFDDTLRKEIWTNKSEWMGAIITYSFKPHGSEKKPRHPVFIGRRMEIDL